MRFTDPTGNMTEEQIRVAEAHGAPSSAVNAMRAANSGNNSTNTGGGGNGGSDNGNPNDKKNAINDWRDKEWNSINNFLNNIIDWFYEEGKKAEAKRLAARVETHLELAKGILRSKGIKETDADYEKLLNIEFMHASDNLSSIEELLDDPAALLLPIEGVGAKALGKLLFDTAGGTQKLLTYDKAGQKLLSQASTGRTQAINLTEQLAMEQSMSDPAAGRTLTNIVMNDARWPASEGWVKMSQNINGVKIHYLRNTTTGAAADFKFK